MNSDLFWVFCTSCFSKPKRDIKFYLTNCSHLLCHKCVNLEQPYCKRCSNECRIIPCDSTMPSDMQEVFHNQANKVEILFKAMSFQEGQRNRLTNYYSYMEQKYSSLKLYAKELHKKHSAVVAEYEKLHRELKEMNKTIEKLQSKVQYYEDKFKSRNDSACYSTVGTPNVSLNLDGRYGRPNVYNPQPVFGNFTSYREQYDSPFSLDQTSRKSRSIHSNSSSHSRTEEGRLTTPTKQTTELLGYLFSQKRGF